MKAELKDYNGRPALFIDDKIYPPMMATIRTINDSEIIFDKDYFENLGKAGIKVFFLICDTIWLKPNALELFDYEARALLEAIPDAYIVPRIGLHPTNEWILENPDECTLYSDGTHPPVNLWTESYQQDLPRWYSLCSQKWREDAGKALEETWNLIMQLPYADRIIGCFLAAGGTSEWYYRHWVSFMDKDICLDHSLAFKREFSSYLRETYGTDENLQKHWKNPDATIDNPPIPTFDKHYFANRVDKDAAVPKGQVVSNSGNPPPPYNGTNLGSFIDHDKNVDIYDFYRAWHLGTANSIIHFAKIIKRLTPGRVVGAFYGSQGCIDFLRSGTNGGTLKILESDCVDFLANPGIYENRQPGGSTGQRTVQDSFAIHGKMYIVEDDARTCAENRYYQDKFRIYDMTDTINVLKREFGRNICEDVHSWWFDQLLGGKRYKFPEVYELFSKQQLIAKDAYEMNRTKNSEVAFIFDEETINSVSFQTTRDLIEIMRGYEMARIGTPVDQYYHNDMANPDMPSYKMYVFINTFILSDEEREVIKAKLRRDHAVAVWLYAPGFVKPLADTKMSVEYMKELTGMDIAMDTNSFDAAFRWNGEAHPISESFDNRALYGYFNRGRGDYYVRNSAGPDAHWDTYLCPLFYSNDKDAKNLAYFLTSGYPAVSVKDCDGYTSVFYGSKSVKSDVFRALAKFAGVHIYCDSDDVTYIGRNHITFHASSSGKKTLNFGRKVDVYEVYEEKFYAKGAESVTFDAYLGETKMFKLIEV